MVQPKTPPSWPRMASSLLLLLLLLFLLFSPSLSDDLQLEFAKQTKTHLHFYFHDVVSGQTPTAIRVAQASGTNSSPTGFGAVVMIDDPLTEGPDPSSKLLGRAQGMYALASQQESSLMMSMNLAFVDGDYNGSTLAVLGRNTVSMDVREMPVLGGTGQFRFARGYALAKTHQFDPTTGDAVVEYNVYIMHH